MIEGKHLATQNSPVSGSEELLDCGEDPPTSYHLGRMEKRGDGRSLEMGKYCLMFKWEEGRSLKPQAILICKSVRFPEALLKKAILKKP